MEQKLAHQATHDLLTGRPNRSVFEDRFRQAVARPPAERDGRAALSGSGPLQTHQRHAGASGRGHFDPIRGRAAGRLSARVRDAFAQRRRPVYAGPRRRGRARRRRARGGADSGDTVAAVFGEGQRGVSGCQHRHRALPAGWRGSARLATGGGQRAVRGQAPGRAHPVVQPGNQPGGQPPLGRRDRTSPCLGARRNIGAYSIWPLAAWPDWRRWCAGTIRSSDESRHPF